MTGGATRNVAGALDAEAMTTERSPSWCLVPLVALCIAAIDWVARSAALGAIDDVAKPATIGALALWMWWVVRSAGDGNAWRRGVLGADGWRTGWWLAALTASLVGDVLLIRPNTVAGGAAFLVAHACFVVAFNRPWLSGRRRWLLAAAGAVALAAIVLVVVRGPSGLVYVGLPIYAAALILMLASAISLVARRGPVRAAAVCVAVGALMFAVSDGMLLIDWSRTTERLALPAIVVYHLGQLAMTAGMLNLLGVGATRFTAIAAMRPVQRRLPAAHPRLLVATAAATGALVVVFAIFAHRASAGGASLERFGRQRHVVAVAALRAELTGVTSAQNSFRLALLAGVLLALVGGALAVLSANAVAARLERDDIVTAGLASVAARALAIAAGSAVVEQLLVWREVDGGVTSGEVWATFIAHGVRWASIAVGAALLGTALLDAAGCTVARRLTSATEPVAADATLLAAD